MIPRQCLLFIPLVLLVMTTPIHGFMRQIKIGAIFHKGDEDLRKIFVRAIAETKHENLAPAFELVPVIEDVDDNTDSFKTAAAACNLLEQGVAAIFGPTSRHTRGIVASIAARFHIPHIEYVWRENEGLEEENMEKKFSSPMTINIFPASEQLSTALSDIVESIIVSTKWTNFAAIYDTDEGLSRLHKILTIKNNGENPVTHTVRQLNEESDYRSLFKEIRNLTICNVIIDVEPKKIEKVLSNAKEVKLLSDYCNFILTYLDSTKLPIVEIRNISTVNITGFSLRETMEDVYGIAWLNSAVLYDAVFLFYKAIETLNARSIDDKKSRFINPVQLSCSTNDTRKYQAGRNIISIMQEISNMGKITGTMEINEYGHRTGFDIHIMNFQRPNSIPKRVGVWKSDGLHLMQTAKEQEIDVSKTMKSRKFVISTLENPPYVMVANASSTESVMIGTKHYEGYCIDLFKEIANISEFEYEFEIVPDGKYGKWDEEKKTWNGLIKRVMDKEVDFATVDLAITYQRKTAVDFSLPFMNLGISIVFTKPEEKPSDPNSFLAPFSTQVWIYMATAYLAVSIMLYLQARMAPGEWDNPHPCNADPEELENNFNLKNSLWLTIGSLMQQGSDILPKAPSIRMLTSMWWFFTLIMISSYTANLAAFLTVGKMEDPIKNVEDLAKQTKIKYGAVEGGATLAFFQYSNYTTYKRMYTTMMDSKPSVFTKSNKKGIERVLNSKRQYAFLMESTGIEYEMQRDRKCELTKIGGLIDNKGYGIAMPRNSQYRTTINNAILTLSEKGRLQQLKDKWWITKGGGKCNESETEKSSNSAELGLENVSGVFNVLILGCSASIFIAICEFLWNIRKVAVEEKITPWEALVAELKFAVNIFALTKPVKIAKSSSKNSASSLEGGLGRAASTARSVVGSFLRLDILDKFDKDHNTNNRSNDRKIN
ncbi:glutamate receptor ionotropic, kainate 2 [Solenopsis invicta]|uniref:glutamate receptor ionotropic, kainate 2 n=1 Tax=Solenopsis invicta TaxID=13686 RepID=UPI00193DFEDF|nr:glutamate receptor ionotropic, kainate 2 [Solenopsis invicta]